ncbi:MAG: alpha,alpha-trehalase TreF [Lewinellaceae bacterium]|nr:alpha,alpha-trehalase TreF [Lewinellaceae bacterium]
MQIHETGSLFEEVQMQQVFPDGKTFPDCLPKQPVEDIYNFYLQQKDTTGFDLKAFVLSHFDLPPAADAGYRSDSTRPVKEHLQHLWAVLTRHPADSNPYSTLIPLPHAFVVPGGRFREIYYWDSYFTMLGLRVSGRTDLIQNMVDNFNHLIHQLGHIPNGNRSYYTSRSQPPFFALMVALLAETTAQPEIRLQYVGALEKEYQFWMDGATALHPGAESVKRVFRLPNGATLNRYWDSMDTPRPESYREDVELQHQSSQSASSLYTNIRAAAESGWDFSHRWFADQADFGSIHTTDIVPVDLNCLLWFLEDLLSQITAAETAVHYQQLADQRKQAILRYCWNPDQGFFFDYDAWKNQQKTPLTLAAVFPLFFNLATPAQAASVAKVLEQHFLQPGGLVTTLVRSGQQWDAPNGWAPLQWMAYIGLKNYGHLKLANEVKTRWMESCQMVYQQSGKMTEKYDVMSENRAAGGGEYPNQDGFGWTNGVYLAMENDTVLAE